jgi:hypothetical protein
MKIHFIDGREIHQIGDYVSVCWETKKEILKKFDRVNNCEYHEHRQIRTGDPYIDFCWIREDNSGEFYVRDDSTADGGLDLTAAKQVTKELQKAVEYLEKNKEYKN